MSDLVRKGGGTGKPEPPEAPLSFAEAAAPRPEREGPRPESPRPDPARPGEDPDAPGTFVYEAALQEIGRLVQAASEGTPLRAANLQRLVGGIVKELLAGDALLLRALEHGEAAYELPRHMLNTAIFAVKIGQGTGCREEELPWLALAACLHDLGMTVIPARIPNKPGKLTDEELGLVRRHPERSFRLLQGLGVELEWLANVAWQHHEREDGSGYPRGLKGDAIHDFAKIIGLADIYEALTHPRAYREARSPLDVIKEIISAERLHFPSHILKGFIRGLSTFPVGSWVRLNTGETARIVKTNPAFPLRPEVEILQGAKGESVEPPRRVDLSANTLLHITDSLMHLPQR